VDTHDIEQRPSRPGMEKRRAGGEAAENRSLDLADVVEPAVDQGLPQVCRGLAVPCWLPCVSVLLADFDRREIGHVQAAEIDGRINETEVTGSDVQRRWQRGVSNV